MIMCGRDRSFVLFCWSVPDQLNLYSTNTRSLLDHTRADSVGNKLCESWSVELGRGIWVIGAVELIWSAEECSFRVKLCLLDLMLPHHRQFNYQSADIQNQGCCGSLKVLEFFFQIFKAWKVLENRQKKQTVVLRSPWICVWRSLKVLGLDLFTLYSAVDSVVHCF